MLAPYLRKIAERESLTRAEAEEAMGLVMEGKATEAQIGAFMLGLRLKGETVDEVAGCATAMRKRADAVRSDSPHLIDTCGTGGDGANTFNISTAAAFVAAACGAVVAKHGNRAVSSKCGSADVMEALGVTLGLDIEALETCLDEIGIAFLFAPRHHAAMKHAAAARREVGVRSVFNLLGPLVNPAGAKRQLIGIYAAHMPPFMAEVLKELGSVRALVVHSRDGLDELSIAAPTFVAELRDGAVTTYEVTPEEAGVTPGPLTSLAGGTAPENAARIRGILDGSIDGPAKEIVILNAGGSLLAAGLAGDLRDGAARARAAVDSGAALDRLDRLIRRTAELAPGP